MINTVIESQFNLVLSASSKEELFAELVKATNQLGFDYFAYGLRVSYPCSHPKTVLFNNYPDSWQEVYDSCQYIVSDPTVLHGMRSTMPVVWNDGLFEDARPLWEDARSHGLSHGWAQSAYARSGVSGLLTLARSDEAFSEAELAEKTPMLVWFNQIAQSGLQKFLLKDLLPDESLHLTQRESEILRWTADGKTASEISIILSISERTVNFHLNNVMNKFGVNSKIAAAVQAVLFGVI